MALFWERFQEINNAVFDAAVMRYIPGEFF
jgi:hypothetical protein